MTQPLLQTTTDTWKALLTVEKEAVYYTHASWWKTAQIATIVTTGIIGIAIVTSPYTTSISYYTLATNILPLVPALLPIPTGFYKYCTSQIALADKTRQKINFLRQVYPQIENDTESYLRIAVQKTFKQGLSEKKIHLLEQNKEHLTPVLAHLFFLEDELQALYIEENSLHAKLANPKISDFDSLLQDPLLTDWQGAIFTAKKEWIEHKNEQKALIFVQDLSKAVSEKSSQAAQKLTALRRKWRSEQSISLTEKWTPLFTLHNKIVSLKIHQLFLWTFILLPETVFQTALQKKQLNIEGFLYNSNIKDIRPSFPDYCAGQVYHDSQANRVLSLSDEVLDIEQIYPEPIENTLDRILSTASK